MDRVKEIFLYFVAALAMFALLCAVYQAMNNKLASAGLLGSLFLVAALILYFPQLEVLKAFGVEARLRQSLDRAEEIIGRLKRLSAISARVSYMTLAWGNRMGTPSVKDKQAILDEVDSQLADLAVTPEERKEITRPYVQLIGFDLYLLFTHVMDRYANWKQTDLTRQLNENQTEEGRAALQVFGLKVSQWRSTALGDNPFDRLKQYKFSDELQRAIPSTWLDEKEGKAVEIFRARLGTLFDACEEKGGYTPEAAEFYHRYHDLGGQDQLIKQLFGVNPSEVR